MDISAMRRCQPLVATWSRSEETPDVAFPSEETPSYAELQREVADLRAEVADLRQDQTPIRLDPQNDRMAIKNLKTPDFHVHDLSLKMDAMSDLFDEHTSLEALLKAGMGDGSEPIDFGKIRNEPMEIEAMKISMPGSTLVRSSQQVSGDALKENDIKGLTIEPRRGDILKIRGKIDKLIDIPFDIEGRLSVHEGNKIEFALGKSKVFGVVPIFGLVKRIVANIAGKNMEEMGVEQRGTSFLMDADDFLPENIKVGLTRVGTEGGRLVLEGKAPEKATAPAPDRTPATLTLGL
jgi:hypothetical protein